jgi:hypothetical protein
MANSTCTLKPGYYGPVTATLDWCEVGMVYISFLTLINPNLSLAGKLSVLSLCRRNGEYLLQRVLYFPGSFWCASGYTSIFTSQIHLWLRRILIYFPSFSSVL